MTDGVVRCQAYSNVTGFVGSHGNRSKPTPLLEEKSVKILIQWVKLVISLITNIKAGDVDFKSLMVPLGQEGRVVEIKTTKG